MRGETTGAQDVPERPAGETVATDELPDAPRERDADSDERMIGDVTAEPGPRRTRSVERLVLEARMVAEDDWRPDNASVPFSVGVGERFRDRIEDTDLVPAWTRPWEQDGGGE